MKYIVKYKQKVSKSQAISAEEKILLNLGRIDVKTTIFMSTS